MVDNRDVIVQNLVLVPRETVTKLVEYPFHYNFYFALFSLQFYYLIIYKVMSWITEKILQHFQIIVILISAVNDVVWDGEL